MACRALWGPRCVHPLAMHLNSSSVVCLSLHSSANTYLHQPTFVVRSFSRGNQGFFVIFFFIDIDTWGEHGGAAVAVGDGVFASSAFDVVVFIVTAFEEDGGIRIGSVAGRLASSARFLSCCTYAQKRKSSAHTSATIFQNGGSSCTVFTDSCWFWVWKTGHCVFHISKSGRVLEVIAIESRASATSETVIIGSGIVDVVVVAVGDSGGKVRGWTCDDIPGSTVFGSVKVPVGSGRTSRRGRNARV
jgi:hypothetical protein